MVFMATRGNWQCSPCSGLSTYGISWADKAGTVASMTESEPGVLSKKLPTTILYIDRDSATRWARRFGVQFDAGNLCFLKRRVHNRETGPAFIFHCTSGALVDA